MAAAPATTPDTPAPQQRPGPARPRRGWPVLARTLLACAAGGLLYLSYPPRGWWWLAPLAFALWAPLLRHRRARAGFGYGLLFGLAYLLPLLHWLQAFLGEGFGPWPWLGLTLLEALFFALTGAAASAVSRLPGAVVWMAALVVAGEAARSRLPLNGFPWGKIAFSQVDGPYLALASLGGQALVCFAVVLTGGGLAALPRALRRGPRGTRRLAGATTALLAPLLAATATWPGIGTDAQQGALTVAVIQGNAPDSGLNLLDADSRALRRNHITRTRQLLADVHAGRVPHPDLVIWPETATDVGPDPARDTELGQLVADLGVPTLIGARQRTTTGDTRNVVIVWDPVTGPGQVYTKQELVPFAEYIPWRAIAQWVTPFFEGSRDMLTGTDPGVLHTGVADLGAAICYEVAYDHVVTDAVRGGARLLVVPTNNAWFGRTEMSYQQLAMSRLRAVEHGRAVVVSATTGVSAIVAPDGTITQATQLFTPDAVVQTVPLRSVSTLATRLGTAPEWGMTGIGLLAVVFAVAVRARRRRGSGQTTPQPAAPDQAVPTATTD
ncbi:apolipoprotein N-acyltransferase [Goodfellowiella coeruleoviolacea]|uniref:Apolipoprotein N-acyltransferase n=1 Tax=Goodfellowiella coeruleoviolacea TaxID=334858 RepID=A0AAE3GHL4_9PSEU|nr:apolipoprotein N-acyltransferase [Goodfellowiella coeruleoviolacea]MCP2167535.1 apolipoprotein N-acyltransferase [Goodfellowiella coeruleoviolacea]